MSPHSSHFSRGLDFPFGELIKTTRTDWLGSQHQETTCSARHGGGKLEIKDLERVYQLRFSKEGELNNIQTARHDDLNEDKGKKHSAKTGKSPSPITGILEFRLQETPPGNLQLTCVIEKTGQLKVLFAWWIQGNELKGIGMNFFFFSQRKSRDFQKCSKAVSL